MGENENSSRIVAECMMLHNNILRTEAEFAPRHARRRCILRRNVLYYKKTKERL